MYGINSLFRFCWPLSSSVTSLNVNGRHGQLLQVRISLFCVSFVKSICLAMFCLLIRSHRSADECNRVVLEYLSAKMVGICVIMCMSYYTLDNDLACFYNSEINRERDEKTKIKLRPLCQLSVSHSINLNHIFDLLTPRIRFHQRAT